MKILVADDDALTRLLLSRLLDKWGYEVTFATDGLSTLELLEQDDGPQLAILDWQMPGMSGVEICQRLREKHRERYTYVLLLTGRDRKEDLIAGLEAGADDYVTKPFSREELSVRLRAGRRIVELEEALRERAIRDALTGAYNRRGILDVLDRELARARRDGTFVTVGLADVDHFKKVNDVHGHQAGDAVLAEIARRLQGALRAGDALGRYGGEELLVVATSQRASGGREIAERLRARIAESPVLFADRSIPVTASFGVAVSGPGMDAARLIKAADEALYRAKDRGRNRVELADEPEPATVRDPGVIQPRNAA
ncbi:MAG: diguanylate cyclase [Byssovorax sp.]